MNNGEDNARNLREMTINHPFDEETESIRRNSFVRQFIESENG